VIETELFFYLIPINRIIPLSSIVKVVKLKVNYESLTYYVPFYVFMIPFYIFNYLQLFIVSTL
jgi:hypothetical protein